MVRRDPEQREEDDDGKGLEEEGGPPGEHGGPQDAPPRVAERRAERAREVEDREPLAALLVRRVGVDEGRDDGLE